MVQHLSQVRELVNPLFAQKGDLLLGLYDADENPVPQACSFAAQQPGDIVINRPTPLKSRSHNSALERSILIPFFRRKSSQRSGGPQPSTTPIKQTLLAIAAAPISVVTNGKLVQKIPARGKRPSPEVAWAFGLVCLDKTIHSS